MVKDKNKTLFIFLFILLGLYFIAFIVNIIAQLHIFGVL